MRNRLMLGLTEQWETAFDQRLAMPSTSPVRMLNALLRTRAVASSSRRVPALVAEHRRSRPLHRTLRSPNTPITEKHFLQRGAVWERDPEVGSQMAPKMAPNNKSGPVLISQYRA